MAELNTHGDQVIALEAIKASAVHERITPVRPPLQPSNHQVAAPTQHPSPGIPAVPPYNAKLKAYTSLYSVDYPPSELPKASSNVLSNPSMYARGSLREDENYAPGLRSIQSPGARSSTPFSTASVPNKSKLGGASSLVRGAMRAMSNTRSAGSPAHGTPASSAEPYPAVTPKPGDPAFVYYLADWRNVYKKAFPSKSDGQIDSLLMDYWLAVPPVDRVKYEAKANAAEATGGTPIAMMQSPTAPLVPGPSMLLKHEEPKAEPDSPNAFSATGISDGGTSNIWADASTDTKQTPQTQFQIQNLLADCSPEQLELGVEKGVELLEGMKRPIIDKIPHSVDAAQWVQQIENLQKQAAKTKTIVGVVGNTGAGKSSVINAMLDEERLVPTNCMRACTAVVTEISYNHEENPYRAEIDFITVADWEKELETLFQDLLDGSGNVSRECTNEDTDAGIAYAKIKAVYPKKTKEDIAKTSIESLLQEVAHILGNSKKIEETDSLRFYKRLQHFVDSKEKSTGDKEKDNKKKDKREMEFWPLIRVVRYVT